MALLRLGTAGFAALTRSVRGTHGLASATLDAGVEAEIRESFACQGMMTTMGASVSKLGPGTCVLSAPFSEAVAQQHGAFHAGATSSLGDSAAGYAAKSLMPPGSDVLATSFSISLLRPAVGERLEARASVIKGGRTLTVSHVDMVALAPDGSEALVATMTQTSICIAKREFPGQAARGSG